MTSIIKVSWIASSTDSEEAPPCFLLQVDEYRFLLDCGWTNNFDMNFIKELKRFSY